MALLSIYRGTQAEVSERPVSDGALLFATDTKKIYLDKGSSRVEMSSLQDLSDYITSTQLSSAIGAEASARQKQDQLLEQAIDDKLGADDIVAGSNVQVSHDDESGHVTISATDTTYTAGAGLALSGTEFGIADGGIIGRYLDDNCVMERNIVVGSVTSDKIPALAITTPKLADNAVTAIKMADDAVATRSIQNGAVTADKLAADVIPEDTNTTYTLTKSGSTITLNGSDGSETSVTDSNTTYSLSSFGITATATELNYMDGVTSNVQTQLNGKAASSHNHSTSNITSGTLRVARGGTGITSNPSMLVNLGSTSSASVFATNPRPGITGTLSISHGGTGATSASAARTALGACSSNIIMVSSTQPTDSECKIWIKP